jgi:rod shape-determining protein MreC
MHRRPRLIALVILTLLVLGLLSLPSRLALQLKSTLGSFFLPLFGLTQSTRHLGEKTGLSLVPRQTLLRQIAQLQQENQTLRIQAMQAVEAQRENGQLRQSMGFQPQNAWHPKLAHVIGRDPANWWRSLTIDLGGRDGVLINAPVVTAEGLVGRIANIGSRQSQVIAVGDPGCLVAAIVQETRDCGILEPATTSPADNTFVDLTHLSRGTTLKPGQRVFTSGLGGVFPKGILVGEIVDTRTADYGLYSLARVKLIVNLSRLEEVFVILP